MGKLIGIDEAARQPACEPCFCGGLFISRRDGGKFRRIDPGERREHRGHSPLAAMTDFFVSRGMGTGEFLKNLQDERKPLHGQVDALRGFLALV